MLAGRKVNGKVRAEAEIPPSSRISIRSSFLEPELGLVLMVNIIQAGGLTPGQGAGEEVSRLKITMIMSVSKVRVWGKPKTDCYWTGGRSVRGGNSKGVRSLHRQNHLLRSEHFGQMVRSNDLIARLGW